MMKINTPEGYFRIVHEVCEGYRVLRVRDWTLSRMLHSNKEECIKQLEEIYGKESVEVVL